MFINYSLRIIYTYCPNRFMLLLGLDKGLVLSPYLLDVYLDDLCLELNSI